LAKLANPGPRQQSKRDEITGACFMTVEYRRILLDGYPIVTTHEGDHLATRDGRSIRVDEAVHLRPCNLSKIICIHLSYRSCVDEYITGLPAAPTYFHKPISGLNSHKGNIIRPERCKWLNYEGEIAIVISKTCPNISAAEAGDYKNKWIRTYVNGELKQDDNTDNMEWDML
jgi:5-oxopent-3-ene-1,2,5-tricarboxylate decarboxylase / 2-hydroxyhepta-2,4-diene-1,7-dioate isomerase